MSQKKKKCAYRYTSFSRPDKKDVDTTRVDTIQYVILYLFNTEEELSDPKVGEQARGLLAKPTRNL